MATVSINGIAIVTLYNTEQFLWFDFACYTNSSIASKNGSHVLLGTLYA